MCENLERIAMLISMKSQGLYLSLRRSVLLRCSRRREEKPGIGKVAILYRISDAGYPKEKPGYINNENCLRNAVDRFPVDQCCWHVIADNVSESTFRMICKYIPEEQIERVSVGHGAGTFRMGYEYALSHFSDDDCVYFMENDYLHKEKSLEVLKEGLLCKESDYVTLYDHLDKYGYMTDNKLVIGGVKTRGSC